MRRRPVAWGGRLGVPTSVVGRTAASVFDRYTAASQEGEQEWLGGRSWAAHRRCHTWAKPWPPGADSSAGRREGAGARWTAGAPVGWRWQCRTALGARRPAGRRWVSHPHPRPPEAVMRMMLKAVVDTEAGNEAARKGQVLELTHRLIEQLDPEAAYFLTEGGQRRAVVPRREGAGDVRALHEPRGPGEGPGAGVPAGRREHPLRGRSRAV